MFSKSAFARIVIAVIATISAGSNPMALELHIDADYSISHEAAEAIELGVRTALDGVGWELGGEPVTLVTRDHRANVKRSHRHMRDYLQSDNAIAMIGGLHSPPYLTHREFINENEILMLLPWSAAGPITRAAPGHENWLFRLSVDDSKAGEFLVAQSVDAAGCRKIALILIETGWGHANFKTLTAALSARGMEPAIAEFFNASLGKASAVTLATSVSHSGADCAIMLSDWDNGAHIVKALAAMPNPVRVFSHWGILGGPFQDEVRAKARDRLNLRVLQSCGLAEETRGNTILKRALSQATGGPARLAEIPAPTGFVHGYDITRVLIAATEQASNSPDWGSAIKTKRRLVRAALQALETPVAGILAEYSPPFVPYSPGQPDAHEALGADDLCMARFQVDGKLAHVD